MMTEFVYNAYQRILNTLVDYMSVCIAICDDTADDVKLLSEALYAYDSSFDIICFNDGQSLIDDFQECGHNIDILFLDIYMSDSDGIKTAERIRREKKDVKIIFITSSTEHYQQAYDVFAFNYIVKPLDREKLYRILDRALEDLKKETSQKIRFSYKSKIYSLAYRDILYIESNNKVILFHKTDGDFLQCYGKLDDLCKELPAGLFIRCHKSFVVNTIHVTEMGRNYFRIGEVVINVSKKYLKPAKERYYEYLFSRIGRVMS